MVADNAAAERTIAPTPELVRRLIADQCPDYGDLAIEQVAKGWDNVIFRLGDDLAVRVAYRESAARLLVNEQRWLPTLAPALPLPVPAPIFSGSTNADCPFGWSVLPWLPGATVPAAMPDTPASIAMAESLADFLNALHQPAPSDAPTNKFRDQPLRVIGGERRTAQLADLPERVRSDATRIWEATMTLPDFEGPPMWIHGDIHPLNVLQDDGVISAVIDFGDMCAADPATDLAAGWLLFSPDARARFRSRLDASDTRPVDDTTWARARGWALSWCVAATTNSFSDEVIRAIGNAGLDQIVGDTTK